MRGHLVLVGAIITTVGLLGSSSSVQAESERMMMMEVHIGPYQPRIDDQFEAATPYADAFGTTGAQLFGAHLDYQFFQGFGSLAIGGGLRYGSVTGHAIEADDGAATDETGLHLMPATLSLVYRFDWPALRFGFPMVPYAKGGVSYTIWWMTNGRGEVANAYDPQGVGRIGMGGTMGWHGGGGIQLLLDWFAPNMALIFDDESGVNNSYLFVEYMAHSVNDFGSSTSLELSEETFSLGLMFEF